MERDYHTFLRSWKSGTHSTMALANQTFANLLPLVGKEPSLECSFRSAAK